MKCRTFLAYSLVAVALTLLSTTPAAAECGGADQRICHEWSDCAFKIFGVCVPGFVPTPPYNGCNSDRLNNDNGVCRVCGRDGAPLCQSGASCDPRHNIVLGRCVACGGNPESGAKREPICQSGEPCDRAFRNVNGRCAPYGYSEEPDCNCTIDEVPPQSCHKPVWGIADAHTHQFSNLAFGGAVFWGSVFDERGINSALAWCDYTHDFEVEGLRESVEHPTLGYLIHGNPLVQLIECPVSASCNSGDGIHSPAGTGSFKGWPKWSTTTHQQMYYRWLERAYKGGLRLMVMFAVNNEVMCGMARRRAGFSCDDMWTVDQQIERTKELEKFVDNEYGGEGKGWYRVVYSPQEARQVIRAGKMAVVLGIEVDALFGCKPDSECSEEHIESQLEHYYNLGVRHLFPIHLFDNGFAGASMYLDLMVVGTHMSTGSYFDSWDCSSEGYDYSANLDLLLDFMGSLVFGVPFNPPNYKIHAANCNTRGLTDKGRFLIDQMMDKGMIIDVDHLSLKALEEVLDIAEERHYPLISSHSFLAEYPAVMWENDDVTEMHRTAEQIRRIRDLGGIVAPLNPRGKCSSTLDYAKAYKYTLEKMSGGPYGKDHPGIAFATDWGGFFQQTAPRFGPEACDPSMYPDAEGESTYPGAYPRLTYPFPSFDGSGWFDEQVTGDRTFNFNEDGLAHVGLMPDFIADLENVGVTREELEPIYHSAETYIRMWEKARGCKR